MFLGSDIKVSPNYGCFLKEIRNGSFDITLACRTGLNVKRALKM